MPLKLAERSSLKDAKAHELPNDCKKAGGRIKTPKLPTFCQHFPTQDNGKVQNDLLRDQNVKRAKQAASEETGTRVWADPNLDGRMAGGRRRACC